MKEFHLGISDIDHYLFSVKYFCIEKFKEADELCLIQYFIVCKRQLYLIYYNFNIPSFDFFPKVQNLIKYHN